MTTELAKNTQEKVQTGLAKINQMLKELQNISAKQSKTNQRFKYNPHANYEYRIFQMRSISELIEIVSFLKSKEKGYSDAADVLGLSEYPQFTWLGYPVSDWVEDIKTRITVITSEDKKQYLLKQKSILEKHISVDMEVDSVWNEIEKL